MKHSHRFPRCYFDSVPLVFSKPLEGNYADQDHDQAEDKAEKPQNADANCGRATRNVQIKSDSGRRRATFLESKTKFGVISSSNQHWILLEKIGVSHTVWFKFRGAPGWVGGAD